MTTQTGDEALIEAMARAICVAPDLNGELCSVMEEHREQARAVLGVARPVIARHYCQAQRIAIAHEMQGWPGDPVNKILSLPLVSEQDR